MQQDMSYISTLDKGYSVKIVRFGIRKEFYNHLLGANEARVAAIKYRDSMYEKYGIGPRHADKPNRYFNSRFGKGSLSGVSLSIEGSHAYFIAKIYDGARWGKKRFSIKKLGYIKAFNGALAARLEQCDRSIDPASIPLHRPTMDEFICLCSMAKDVPTPAR